MEIIEINERAEQKSDPFHTIQIHPTRKCNLTCLHCYSSAGPGFKEMLDVEALKRFLAYAYQHGFNNISVSGGEPFLYDGLEELFKYSRSLGYQNTMASNGMLLQSERNQRILEYVDLIAISLDGPEELHDQIRLRSRRYAEIQNLDDTGIRQFAYRSGFALKGHQLFRRQIMQNFHRHQFFQKPVFAHVHRTRGSLTQNGERAVTLERKLIA